MTLVLGVDFETTGLSSVDDRVIEVGACLYEWETGTPLQLISEFVHPERPIPEEITKITGITDELVNDYGISEREAFTELDCFISRSHYIMAHFGSSFDKLFFDETRKRMGWDQEETLWLDSAVDVRYPERITTRNLRHLASEHNFLATFAHRAVFDVLTMLTVANGYSLDGIVARAKEPTLVVQAVVSFDEKEKAKELQFRWFAPQKLWWKSMKQSDYLEMRDTCGFRTQLLTKAPE